jgi:hypothetical protein
MLVICTQWTQVNQFQTSIYYLKLYNSRGFGVLG